jgi:RNA-directed DNA polymerase
VISPLLLNVALHGMEEAAGVRYRAMTGRYAGKAVDGTPVLVRYADDLVVCCSTRQQAEQVKAQLADWLAPRGLAFNEDKTRVVDLDEGFDFLGFHLRRYRRRRRPAKLLIKPSQGAVRRIRSRLADEVRRLRGSNAMAVIARLNPIIRGWAAYYRGVVSSRAFSTLDNHVWWLTYRWARRSHPNKSKWWTMSRYFDRFNKFRNDRWVFGDPALVSAQGGVVHLLKFSWTNIVRHQTVKGTASPDDPALTRYWAARRRRIKPPLDSYTLHLLDRQDSRCPLCGDPVLAADQPPNSPQHWESWWLAVTRKAIQHDYLVHHGRPGSPDGDQTRLVHASSSGCRRRRTQQDHTASLKIILALLADSGMRRDPGPRPNPRASSPVNDSWITACCVARICHLPRSTSRTSPSTKASDSSATDALWNDSWNEPQHPGGKPEMQDAPAGDSLSSTIAA